MTSTALMTTSTGDEVAFDLTAPIQRGRTGAGKTRREDLLLAAVATATADTATNDRVRGLLAELVDVAADEDLARRCKNGTGQQWLAELAIERRDVWEHLHEALTLHTV
jgi:hypothetical protein